MKSKLGSSFRKLLTLFIVIMGAALILFIPIFQLIISQPPQKNYQLFVLDESGVTSVSITDLSFKEGGIICYLLIKNKENQCIKTNQFVLKEVKSD